MQQSRSLGVADKVDGLFGQTSASLAGNLLGALMLLAVMHGTASSVRLLGFCTAFALVWLMRAWVTLRFFRSASPNRTPALSRRWIAWWNTGALASGVVWGVAAWTFYPSADAVGRTLLLLTVYSFCVGSIPVLATQPRVFLAFVLCCFVPLTLCVGLQDDPGAPRVAGMLVLVFGVTAMLGHRFGRVFETLVWLKARAEQLREELAAEKAAVQAAMTQLRHAIPSTSAGELHVEPLWEELRLDHEHLAAYKRLSLSFHGHKHRAAGHEAQLAPLLRELLACALHTTTEGGIVVAARPLGHQLRLQVWNTAMAALDARVQARLDEVAHRAAALGIASDMRAVAGHGRCCELRIPLARQMVHGDPMHHGGMPPRPLRGAGIAILDDDPASRSALHAAFSACSDTVQANPSSEALSLASPAEPPLPSSPGGPVPRRPRNRQGSASSPLHLGVIGISPEQEARLPALVSAVRAQGGDRLPVLVVADEASPSLRAQALAARFHVVTRPVKPATLWPLVEFKLGLAPHDRDPTFTLRLARDSHHWARSVGTPRLSAEQLSRIAARGHHFMPASRRAMAHRRGNANERQHVVLVHGGLSSVRAAMSDAIGGLLPLLGSLCAWRFEHDAFLPVNDNVDALVRHVARTVCAAHEAHGMQVALVGHSRGGIVARLAAAQLQRDWPALRVRVYTFGTPHGGTEVFRRIGERWSRIGAALAKMRNAVDGVAAQDFVSQLDMVARAFDYDIPAGFRDVEPARVSPLLQAAPPFDNYVAWCSRWVPGSAPAPGLDLLSQLVEAVSGFEPDGDGLVSAASATKGATCRHDASPLFHTGYFGHRRSMGQLQSDLASFLHLHTADGPDRGMPREAWSC